MTKKQLIMDKALELFAEQGFESTSVQQITEHSGISKGAFYLSFKSKDELILALIDYFMSQFTADIDYLVKSTKEDDKLLYNFYHFIFNSFKIHSDFAKILMKEQTQSFNKGFIIKVRTYDQLLDNMILSMVERLYGEEINQTKHDLSYCIKGFTKTYSELFLFSNLPLDVDLLARSLVEKTNVLAKHVTIPFLSNLFTEQFTHTSCEQVEKEDTLNLLEQTIADMEESIEKESLLLLQQQLVELTLSPAIIKGLLENIRKHPHCKWVAYLLRGHFKL